MALAVTDRAAAGLKEALDEIEREPEQTLRLIARTTDAGDQLGLALDEPQAGDQEITYGDDVVMVISEGLSDLLSSATLDMVEGPDGPAFTLK